MFFVTSGLGLNLYQGDIKGYNPRVSICDFPLNIDFQTLN